MNSESYTFDNLMVATDGSEQSKKAFNQALEVFSSGNLFKVIHIVHVSNKEKTYLPKHFTLENIEQEYKTELLSRLTSNRYNLIFQEKNAKYQHSRDQILDICSQTKGDFLFIGYTGRKGPKNDPTVLSQTVRGVAFNQMIPLVIVKELFVRKNQASGGFTYLVGIDGSKKSLRCLHIAASLANSPNDKLIACFAPSPDRIKQIDEMNQLVQNEMANINFQNWQYVSLKPNYDSGEAIINYVNLNEEVDVQFVIIGNNGHRAESEKKAFFGRSAEQILSKVIANPIIIT
ncbi:hypothetical protein ABPG74_018275 [Tetrahymena malaccensis]